MKFIKQNWKMLAIVTIIVILFPIIILTPSRYGTITYDTGLVIVSYGGSILGGFLTLYGVWWTILEQKKDLKEQQKKLDDQRRKDFAIQYRAIFQPNIVSSKKLSNCKVMVVTEHKFIFSNTDDFYNPRLQFTIGLKNIGHGEALNFKFNKMYFINSKGEEINFNFDKLSNTVLTIVPVNEQLSVVFSCYLPKNWCSAKIGDKDYNLILVFSYQNLIYENKYLCLRIVGSLISLGDYKVSPIYHFSPHSQIEIV